MCGEECSHRGMYLSAYLIIKKNKSKNKISMFSRFLYFIFETLDMYILLFGTNIKKTNI